MIKSEYKIGSVWGIPIKIHISLLILLFYMIFKVSGENTGTIEKLLNIALVTVIGSMLFGSIALHELGHSFVAIRKGCRVYEITLMFMGGAAKMDRMPSRPLDEFLMAIAGPTVSIVLGTACLAMHYLLNLFFSTPLANFIAGIFWIVGSINLVLAVFNLIPAFPMDGGRVFRALLSSRMGRLKATFVASRLGRVIAVAFFFIGIFGLNISIRGMLYFPPHNFVLIIIAFFIFTTADKEFRMVQIEELMKHRQGQGHGGFQWPFQQNSDAGDDDAVIISPPPYVKGPATRSKIQIEDEKKGNPFSRFFGR